MTFRTCKPAERALLVAGLLAAFFLQSFLASRIKSPSSDEPPHIASGLSYIEAGNFHPNPEHPPLIKELSAISLLVAGYRLPHIPLVEQMFREKDGDGQEWFVGHYLIADKGPDGVLLWARLPVMLLSVLLGLTIYLWGREMAGEAAALGALFLFAADPTLVAHSAFVTTDMGLAAFGTLFFFSVWRYIRRPSWPRLLWCGLTMGLALCAKFSAVLLVPLAVPLLLAGGGQGESLVRRARHLAVTLVTMSAVAALVMMAVYRSPAGPAMYVHGLSRVYFNADPTYRFYMAGQKQTRFYSYFVVAWLLKEPLATVALVLTGAWVLLRDRRVCLSDKLFVFLPPAVLFAACTLLAADIGVRYVIPAFPFACLAGGIGLAWLIQAGSKRARGLAVALTVWLIVAAAGIYPDHLAYFNEAACLLREPGKVGLDGGTRCGPLWLDDSNVDWGQGLRQLRTWLDAHPDRRIIRMAYFGSFPPENYGITALPSGIGEFDLVATPGFYVISAELVAKASGSWLRTIPPKAIVGHAYYVYDIAAMQFR